MEQNGGVRSVKQINERGGETQVEGTAAVENACVRVAYVGAPQAATFRSVINHSDLRPPLPFPFPLKEGLIRWRSPTATLSSPTAWTRVTGVLNFAVDPLPFRTDLHGDRSIHCLQSFHGYTKVLVLTTIDTKHSF
ncbi:hypothetical protein MUK42_27882 [Musa troglodytarum]|uniref:Uncharacterized protein n=1 Tax=Musa troglodytarum TaxID=320322 RepID=A0A9E7FHT1_9LILI|nr:hypothetical protein MUK42_27882 [Musa troglodytarum]